MKLQPTNRKLEKTLVDNIASLGKEEEVCVIARFVLEPKYPPFYILMKIRGKISHCCLKGGGSNPNSMSKVIMK